MSRFRNVLRVLAVALVGAALFGAPSRAEATFTLTLHETGFADVMITDNGAGDLSAAIGAITYSGSFGDFSLEITTGTSNSATGALPAQLMINSLSVTGVVPNSALVITLQDTGFTAPSGGKVTVHSELSNTQLAPGTSVSFLSTVDGQVGTLVGQNTVFGQQWDDYITLSSNPYTIKNVTTITMGTAGSVQTTGITAVSPAPAPAGLVLALTGVPFLGLGSWLRRRKQA